MLCYVLDKNMISTNFVLMVKFTAIDEHELTALHKFPSNKIVIHLNHLKKNFQCIQKTKSKNTQIIGMIKSNAYGHGIVPVSSLLSNLQIDSFGVFTIEEGIQLREHNIQTPTLIFSSLLEPHMKALHQFHLTPVIGSFKELQVFLEDKLLAKNNDLKSSSVNFQINPYGILGSTNKISKKANEMYKANSQ